jgi:hypothetical protein
MSRSSGDLDMGHKRRFAASLRPYPILWVPLRPPARRGLPAATLPLFSRLLWRSRPDAFSFNRFVPMFDFAVD